MKIEAVSINGNLHSPDAALIQATDHGLMYGVNAFETLRVHEGAAFLLEEHFDRLEKSLKALGIRWDVDRKKYYSWTDNICSDIPKGKDGFIRFVVTAGSEKFWVSGEEYSNPTVVIYRGHISPYEPVDKKAAVLKGVRRIKPEYFADTGFRIKSLDYVSARIAKLELKESGFGIDGVVLTPDGFVAEGLTSNIFWVKEGNLYTPPLDTGILAGTVRAYLLAENKVTEKLAKPEELENADEVFLTSGSSYLNPLVLINDVQKPGITGPVFEALYKKLLIDIKNRSKPLR